MLTATARLRAYVRVLTVLVIGWFSYRNARWEFCLFLAGMVIAEADLARGAHIKPPATPSPLPVYTDSPSSKEKAVDDDFAAEGARIAAANRARASRALWALTSILGLYLLCYPDGRGEETPGWVYLTSKIPEWWTEHEAPFRYWQSAGAVLFVAAVGHLAGWQRFFCTGPVQYLGKISYAIYLVHGPVMHSCGYMMERWAYDWSGLEGYQYNWGFALSTALCVPAVVFWADVFWRAFDIPTVKFAKWLEGVLVVRT